jgi:hypothetical protein
MSVCCNRGAGEADPVSRRGHRRRAGAARQRSPPIRSKRIPQKEIDGAPVQRAAGDQLASFHLKRLLNGATGTRIALD